MMKKIICSLAITATLFSCSKSGGDDTVPVIDNGPLGGTYNFTSCTTKSYDTIPGSGIVTTHEFTSTTTSLQGTLSFTATTISNKGLMYNWSTSGVRKETNTTTGATITSNIAPTTGPSGNNTNAFSSAYSFSVAGSEMSVSNAQYLFNPAFITLPASQKYKYTFTGGVLKVTIESYDAAQRFRSVCEVTFTKQ